jgi:L-gulonolactone oxidase
VNWGRNQRSTAAGWARPENEAQVVELVHAARASGRQLKVVGGAHSWSDIAMSANASALLVSLDAMTGVIEFNQVDEEHAQIEVWAGTRLEQLNEELAQRGWAMPILGSVAVQSVAGVIATGTHGSSLQHGNLSTLVEAITLIDGHGELRRIDRGEDLDFARVSLGAIGIISRVRLRVCRAFRLEETLTRIPWEQARSVWRERAETAAYLKIWWLPPSDDLLFFEYTPTEKPTNANRLANAIDAKVVNPLVFPLFLRLGARFPALVHPINRLIHALRFGEQSVVDRSDRRFTLAMPPVHREVEYALPIDRAFDGFDALRDMVRSESMTVNFIQEIRFVKGDRSWMSAAHGGDVAQLGAYLAPCRELDAFFRGFESRMRALGGRPHWGKEFEGIGPEQVRQMWPQAAEFSARAREFDPQGVFVNAFVERVLGQR